MRRIRPHFWTFSICFIATTVFYVYVHAIDADTLSWRDAPTVIIGNAVSAAGFWIVFSPILVEGVAMVFAAMFRQQTRKKDREEGRAEANTAWREWNRRREEADAAGKPFDEPAPDSANGTDPSGN